MEVIRDYKFKMSERLKIRAFDLFRAYKASAMTRVLFQQLKLFVAILDYSISRPPYHQFPIRQSNTN